MELMTRVFAVPWPLYTIFSVVMSFEYSVGGVCMYESRMPQIEHYVRDVMSSVQRPELKLAHDFKHVDRVRNWAVVVAQDEQYRGHGASRSCGAAA